VRTVGFRIAYNGRGFAEAGRKLWIFRPRRNYKLD